MSTIKEKLTEGMKAAMKSGDKDTVTFSRNLLSAINKKEIDDRSTKMDDAGVQRIIATMAKQRQDSIDQFRDGGREDLVAKEEAELKFLQGFLPQQLSEDEVGKLVDEAIAETNATTIKDMGNVMKALMPKVQGRADGKLVSQLVRQKLGGT